MLRPFRLACRDSPSSPPHLLPALRSLIRKTIASLPLGGLAWLSKTQILSLFYHTCFETPPPYFSGRYRVKPPKEIESDLDVLLLQGFQPINLSDLVSARHEEGGTTRKRFFLSFDDGYRELAETIAPILLRKGVPATFFLCSGFVDNQNWFFEDQLGLAFDHYHRVENSGKARDFENCIQDHGHTRDSIHQIQFPPRNLISELGECLGIDWEAELGEHKPYLTSKQVEDLIGKGFTIGAHSVDHTHFTAMDEAHQYRQVKESQDWICSRFDLPYRAFAFPYTERGVAAAMVHRIKEDGVSDILFGTRGLMKDEFHPFVQQRLWAEDHPGSLQAYLKAQLAAQFRGHLESPARQK